VKLLQKLYQAQYSRPALLASYRYKIIRSTT